MQGMWTLVQYLIIAIVVGGVVFLAAAVLFGRGEGLAPLPPRTSPTDLPEGGVSGEDIRRVRFGVALRGYRMSDVDWTLDRLADEIDRLDARVRALEHAPVSAAGDVSPSA